MPILKEVERGICTPRASFVSAQAAAFSRNVRGVFLPENLLLSHFQDGKQHVRLLLRRSRGDIGVSKKIHLINLLG
jgi:hypothetical protein